jgi:hypothetical protein
VDNINDIGDEPDKDKKTYIINDDNEDIDFDAI